MEEWLLSCSSWWKLLIISTIQSLIWESLLKQSTIERYSFVEPDDFDGLSNEADFYFI